MRFWAVTCAAIVAALCVLHASTGSSAAAVDVCAIVPQTNHLAADAAETGVITLAFYNAEGAPVTFFECVDGRAERLGSARADPVGATNPPVLLKDAVTWSCSRLVRRFAAIATLPDGSLATGAYAVHTRACSQRFTLSAPRRTAVGAVARLRVRDTWGIGRIHPRLCITPPGAQRTCRTLAFARDVSVLTQRFRASAPGRWKVALQVRGHRDETFVAVGGGAAVRRAAPPTVLATGDSTMQGIDSFLADELGDRATVHSDVIPGAQVSRAHFWTRHAKSQTTHLHQRITVISVGAASDGLPLRAADGTLAACCGAPWVRAYRDRVRSMMRTYLQDGRGRVFWLTPPLARFPPRAQITNAVAVAALSAAHGLQGVTVVRIDRFFSPAGYSETIRYRGHDVHVRESDGIHLNVSGTAIAARLLAPAIRQALASLDSSS